MKVSHLQILEIPESKFSIEENREYKQKISALTKQLKGEQQYADEQEEALGIFRMYFDSNI